jgi:hypothetical protein
LTVASFTKVGYSLKNISIPLAGGPDSFADNRSYSIGDADVVVYSPTSKTLVSAPSSAK